MLFAGLYTLNYSKEKLYSVFNDYRTETTGNIANAMADPIYYFSPNDGSLVLEIIKRDPRISKIEVYDTMSDMSFIEFSIPERTSGTIYTNNMDIVKDGEPIGWVKIQFSDSLLQEELNNRESLLIWVFGVVTVVLFLFMFPLMYFKILAPLNRLLLQANDFKAKKLDRPFHWKGSDEISALGENFEIARVSILELVNELQDLYITDRLTGLNNRHKLDEVLAAELKRCNRFEYTFSLIILDIDHFKSVNDTYGHQVGDSVLVEFSAILSGNKREVDIIGRWGG